MFKQLISVPLQWPVARRVSLHWRSNKLTRSVATMAGANIVAQALSLLITPLTTRLYSPADYGMAGVFASLIGILCILATFRYETAVMLPKNEEEAREVLCGCVLLAVASSFVAGFLAWLCGGWVSARLGAPGLYRYWWMVPFSMLGAALYQSYSSWVLRRKEYAALAWTRLSQTIASAAVVIGFGLWVKGPAGLLLGAFAANTVGIGRLSRGAFRGLLTGGVFASLTKAIRLLATHGRFALFSTGASILNASGLLGPPLLLSALYGQDVVGAFSLAQRVVLLPATLVGATIAQVFLAEAGEILRRRPAEMSALFKQMTKKAAFLALAPIVIGLVCPWLFPVLFGWRWKAAGAFASLLSLACAGQLIAAPVAGIAILRQRQDLQLAIDAVRFVLVCGSLWAPAHFGMGPHVAVGCYAVTMSLMYGVYYMVYLRLANECSELAPIAQASPALAV